MNDDFITPERPKVRPQQPEFRPQVDRAFIEVEPPVSWDRPQTKALAGIFILSLVASAFVFWSTTPEKLAEGIILPAATSTSPAVNTVMPGTIAGTSETVTVTAPSMPSTAGTATTITNQAQ